MTVRFLQIHEAPGVSALKEVLVQWGYEVSLDSGEGTLVIVSDRPDPRWLPPYGNEVLWWVKDATPEEASLVLSHRSGWVVRQDQPLAMVREAFLRRVMSSGVAVRALIVRDGPTAQDWRGAKEELDAAEVVTPAQVAAALAGGGGA